MTDLRERLVTFAQRAGHYGDAGEAIRRARRRRSRRWSITAGAAALAVATAATLWVQTGGLTSQPQPAGTGAAVVYFRDGSVLARLDDPQNLATPAGFVVNHVLSELSHAAGSPLNGLSWQEIRDGGYEIVTTLEPGAQQSLEAAVASAMDGQPDTLATAAVVIEPGTGRVLAYYGGPEGTQPDFAGVLYDEQGAITGYGRHTPGSSFAVHTLAAALRNGYSLNSRWQWTPHEQAGRPQENPVRNGNRTCPDSPDGYSCSLLDVMRAGLPVALYDVAHSVSTAGVLATAHDAGIRLIWNNAMERLEIDALGVTEVVGNRGISTEIGIGQYPVTVLDQANAMATYAAGVQAPAHFVRSVSRGGESLYTEPLPGPEASPILTGDQRADLGHALTRVSGQDDLALLPGEWQIPGSDEISDAWSVGFSTEVAVAVWLGNESEVQPLRDQNGGVIYGSGLPAQILQQVVAGTHSALGLSPAAFPPPVFGGVIDPPGSVPGG